MTDPPGRYLKNGPSGIKLEGLLGKRSKYQKGGILEVNFEKGEASLRGIRHSVTI